MRRILTPTTALIALAVALLILFALLYLQYPIQRFLLQDDFRSIEEIENAIQRGKATQDDLDELKRRANSSNTRIQNYALRVIGRSKTPNFNEVEILSQYLLDSEHATRRAAILAMKDQGADAKIAMTRIRECMLHDPNQVDVSVFAAQTLGSFGGDAEPALEDLRKARASTIEAFRTCTKSPLAPDR